METEALFNLTPDVRTPLCGVEFHPEPDMAIETSLKYDFLPHLADRAANIEEAATYLLSLSQEQSDNPLLSTENWLAPTPRK